MMKRNILDASKKTEYAILKSFPCIHGKCPFCIFTRDNSTDSTLISRVNQDVIDNIDGRYKRVEIYNSGSAFEIPLNDLFLLKKKLHTLDIKLLITESHWHYREKFGWLRDFFELDDVIIKIGVETFNTFIREKLMKKNMGDVSPYQISMYTNAVNLLIGFKGQDRDSVSKDIELARELFSHIDINLIDPAVTHQSLVDTDLTQWFLEKYEASLKKEPCFRIFYKVEDCDATFP